MHFAVGGPFPPPAGAFVAEPAGAAAGVFVAAADVLAGASVVAAAGAGAVAPWSFSMPPWPLHAPWPPLLFVPSLQVTSAVAAAPAAVDVPGALAVGASAVLDDPPQLVGAFVFVAFLGFDASVEAAPPAAPDVAEALLSTPPWPLQAPFPAWLFVPSLQVTSAAAEAPAAAELPAVALAAGAAAELEDASELVAVESFDFEAFFGFASLAGAAAVLGVLDAPLSTPPWPLHAPFPAWLFVPSLQVTSAAASAALATRGSTIASATSATDARTIRATITELPC